MNEQYERLIDIAEEYDIVDVDWFVSFCEYYYETHITTIDSVAYCHKDWSDYLVDSFWHYVEFLEESDPGETVEWYDYDPHC